MVSQASHLGLAERVTEDDEDVEVEVKVDGMNEVRAKRMATEGMKRRSQTRSLRDRKSVV